MKTWPFAEGVVPGLQCISGGFVLYNNFGQADFTSIYYTSGIHAQKRTASQT